MESALAQWEAELAPLDGIERLQLVVKLAWHLRQRDPERARKLARDASDLLPLLGDAERSLIEARFMLIEGEAKWLFGELDAARAVPGVAFDAQHDAIGSADARWLRAWIEVDRGNSAASDVELAVGAEDARRGGDPIRTDVIDAASALFAVFRDLHSAEQRWGGRFDVNDHSLDLAALGWIHDYLGTAAFQASDFGRAVSLLMRAYEAAMSTGQVRRAINIATNIGNGFTSLNAHHAALEWMQRGLDLADRLANEHWPRPDANGRDAAPPWPA